MTVSTGLMALQGKLYAVGGSDKYSNALSSVEVFDPSNGTWVAAPSMTTVRDSLGLAAFDGKLYAAGGENNSEYQSATVEVFDPALNKWVRAPSMGTARDSLGLAALGGKLYAVGGYAHNASVATCEVFDLVRRFVDQRWAHVVCNILAIQQQRAL